MKKWLKTVRSGYFLIVSAFALGCASRPLNSNLEELPPTADVEIQVILKNLQTLSEEKKLEKVSESLLNHGYARDPLGEGPSGVYDQDPLYRLDLFDCTTYIETVLSLTLSKTLEDFKRNIIRIRYKNADINFNQRNHFPELDWVPNNTQENFISDTTNEVGLSNLSSRETEIVKKAWFEKLPSSRISIPKATADRKTALLNKLHHEGDQFSPTKITIKYI